MSTEFTLPSHLITTSLYKAYCYISVKLVLKNTSWFIIPWNVHVCGIYDI